MVAEVDPTPPPPPSGQQQQASESPLGGEDTRAAAGGALRLPAVQRGGSGRLRHYSNHSNGRSEDIDSLTYSQDGSSVRIRRDGTGTSSMRSAGIALTPSDSQLWSNSPTQGPGLAPSTTSASAGVGLNGEPLTVEGPPMDDDEKPSGRKAKRSISDDNGFDDDDWDDEVLYYGKSDKIRDDKDAAKSGCCGCVIM
ncbi:hypothetical protein FOL47_011229 [Perkinsus chesapeaki]|uniref:Uncharacterized protein n=1 Tax=Perkinsus chesapeaki TaxID=330153 RepID=A0A7J6L049_PERCH|nr:hypothetical protein FOL47_011229 [Perkinsus chesapeaki]